jgi:type VI protein secretion system component Hcp
MPTDAYVRFGEMPGVTDEYTSEPYPEIEGDCSDKWHFFWCELRDTGYNVEFPYKDKNADDDSTVNAPPSAEKKVTLKKRVDWASTRLFLRCCQAAQARIDKSKTEDGTIKKVMVEICKDAGWDEKFAYLAIEYSNVRILDYSIDMSDPEPAETIQFEYDSFRMGYRATDPNTGLPKGEMEWTEEVETVVQPVNANTEAGSQQTGSAVAAALSAQGASIAGSGGGSGGNGAAAPAIATSTDAAVNVNFPGVWGPTGFGILPD